MKFSSSHPRSLNEILTSLALPFLIFSTVLLGLLAISRVMLLPKLTEVEISGKLHNTRELQQYVSHLQANVLLAEQQRNLMVNPLRGGLFGEVREEKLDDESFLLLRSRILDAASNIVATKDAVHISSLVLDQEEGTLKLSGRVYNVGPRSMTVLAQFVDKLRSLPFVSDIVSPKFTRKTDDGKSYSPFDFIISLQ